MGFCGSRLDPAAQALLQRRTAGLHGSGPLQDPVCPAENVDRQGGLSEAERADLMDLALSAEQQALRENIVDFARKELSGGAAERDRAQHFPRDLWDKCGAMGLTGLPVPEQHGGAGLPPLSCAVALEAFGYGCADGGLAFSVCAHLLACVVPIWKHGDEPMKRRYLPELCTGRLIAVNAMTEAQTGSDPFAMSTRAERDGKGFRLIGSKMFCCNGGIADLVVVYALTDKAKGYHGGITAFLVPCDAPGFSVGQTFEKMGLRTSPIGELLFDGVYVPEENVIGRVGAGPRSSPSRWTGNGRCWGLAMSVPCSACSRARCGTRAPESSSAN